MRKMMPNRSHDDRVPDLPQYPTALFQNCRKKSFVSTLHFVDGTLSAPDVDTGFPRFIIFEGVLRGALWLRDGRFAILTDVRSNVVG
jgi:hypothetical protein